MIYHVALETNPQKRRTDKILNGLAHIDIKTQWINKKLIKT